MSLKSTNNNLRTSNGFTLIEVVVGAALFAVVSLALMGTFSKMLSGINLLRVKSAATNLATEEFEIIRNLPYSDVGISGSIPSGVLQHVQSIVRDAMTFQVTTTVRNVDNAFDGVLGGTPNDLSPADNKIVEIEIACTTCPNFSPLTYTTTVAPKNLETASTNGALFIKVFDANGQPLEGMQVHVVSTSTNIAIDDVTNDSGLLQIIDAPPGNEIYQITVSNTGYSTERTYPSGASGNQHPSKPHASVLVQKVTQISFSIDKTSTMNISSVTPTCQAVASVPFSLVGAKLIGINPTVYKYNTNQVTSAAGTLALNNVEWDTYTPTLTSSLYYLAGSNPLLPVSVSPDAVVNMNLVVVPKDPSSVLVSVKDGSTNLSISDATVSLNKSGATTTLTTGQGYFRQSDWSGGSGQSDFTNAAKYFSSDGNVEVATPTGEIRLKQIGGNYQSSGVLTSSTFDTGAANNFQQILWQPADQPVATGANSVRFQIATASDNTATTTWNYIGPDGTASTYYTVLNQNISSANDNKQYLRYKVYLATDSSAATPNISDVAITYTASCTPPGQVLFGGLSAGTYTITVSKAGYQTYTGTVVVGSTWQQQDVLLNP
jgi:prepilin-type N-terminal cleavage/methylation domain-containing protein